MRRAIDRKMEITREIYLMIRRKSSITKNKIEGQASARIVTKLKEECEILSNISNL